MSMWDWDEQGESYPPEDRQHYRDPYASHSGSSEYRGAHHSYRDHSHHHHHGHTGHNHDHHHHHQQDDAHSYHGQRSPGASPSRHNYGVRHESYEDPQNYGGRESNGEEDRGRQSYGWHDSNDDQGDDRNSYGSPTHASNMVHAPASQSAHYRDDEGYDSSAGYEIRQEHHSPPPPTSGHGHEGGHGHEASNRTDLFTSNSVVNLTLDEIDALARTHRSRAWLVVLYAPWCRFCQAMEPNFERVAEHLENSNVYVGRFRADGDYKEYAKRYLQLEHFPTVLFFPKDSSNIVKYHSENREVDALLGFVQAFEIVEERGLGVIPNYEMIEGVINKHYV